MASSQKGPASYRAWVKAQGTHNAPIFPVGEGDHPRLEKENMIDRHIMGNSR